MERHPLDVLRGSVVRYDGPSDPVVEGEIAMLVEREKPVLSMDVSG
jgi:hypothetical protein